MSDWLEEIRDCRDDLKRLIKQCMTKADAFQATGNSEMMKFFDGLSSIDYNLNKAVDNKIDTDLALASASIANTLGALAKGRAK